MCHLLVCLGSLHFNVQYSVLPGIQLPALVQSAHMFQTHVDAAADTDQHLRERKDLDSSKWHHQSMSPRPKATMPYMHTRRGLYNTVIIYIFNNSHGWLRTF